MARYLREAPVLIASPGSANDVLDPDRGLVGTASVHTDGVWAWPGDLAAYVEGKHLVAVRIPWTPDRAELDLGAPDLTSVQFRAALAHGSTADAAAELAAFDVQVGARDRFPPREPARYRGQIDAGTIAQSHRTLVWGWWAY